MHVNFQKQDESISVDALSIITAAREIDVSLATEKDPYEQKGSIYAALDRSLFVTNSTDIITDRLVDSVSLRKLKYKDHDRLALIAGMLLYWMENES